MIKQVVRQTTELKLVQNKLETKCNEDQKNMLGHVEKKSSYKFPKLLSSKQLAPIFENFSEKRDVSMCHVRMCHVRARRSCVSQPALGGETGMKAQRKHM
jgi:hypothetical protein